MPKRRIRSLRCPICRKIVLRAEAEFPFCSQRCRLLDLGKWASGGYVVSTPIADPEALGAAEVPPDTSTPAGKDTPHHGRTRN
ncbi:MAG TPA: DNA gyrase inhibitor YacG [Terriglobales bacterium]|nr:DNA gyrase inhibitor YacG [Terriglobales bacterium]